MSETVSKQVLIKLDEMQKDVSEVKMKVVEIETKLNGIPDLDKAKHDILEQKIEHHEKRLNNVESWGKWGIVAVLGVVINAIMQLVLNN